MTEAAKAIEPFTAQAYAEKIREKIRGAIVDVIPDEQWDQLIRNEMAKMFEEKHQRDHYGGTDKILPSEFQTIVRQVLSESIRSRVKAMLEAPEWAQHWDGQKYNAGERVKELVVNHSGEILSAWLGNVFASFLSQMKSTTNFTQTF